MNHENPYTVAAHTVAVLIIWGLIFSLVHALLPAMAMHFFVEAFVIVLCSLFVRLVKAMAGL